MGCSCKHNQREIEDGLSNIAKLRVLFIKRMTEDNKTRDARRRDFNQAIFSIESDYDVDSWNAEVDRLNGMFGDSGLRKKEYGESYQVWDRLTLDMVLRCFDDAVKDWRRLWCDDKECGRK